MRNPLDRAQFLNMAGVFEGGMLFVALALGWLFGLDALDDFKLSPGAVALGLAAALPPLLLFMLIQRLKIPALERIERVLQEIVGPSLAACRWYDLVLLAALAGIGEEFLFRGVLQPLCERWFSGFDGRWAGLIVSNVVFGLLHALTASYAVLAAAMGAYFGVLLDITGSRNLVVPVVAHGFYDYLAFLLLLRNQRQAQAAE